MKALILKALSEVLYLKMILFMYLPDFLLARVFGLLRVLSQYFIQNEEAPEVLLWVELEGFFKTHSPLCKPLRRMILHARPSQVKSFLRGFLRNYVFNW